MSKINFYISAFLSEFEHDKDSFDDAFITLSSVLEPAVMLNDSVTFSVNQYFAENLEFNSAEIFLNDMVRPDGPSFVLLFTRNAQQAAMFASMLDTLKKFKGAENRIFCSVFDAGQLSVGEITEKFESVIMATGSTYSDILSRANPLILAAYLKSISEAFCDKPHSSVYKKLDSTIGTAELLYEFLSFKTELCISMAQSFIDTAFSFEEFSTTGYNRLVDIQSRGYDLYDAAGSNDEKAVLAFIITDIKSTAENYLLPGSMGAMLYGNGDDEEYSSARYNPDEDDEEEYVSSRYNPFDDDEEESVSYRYDPDENDEEQQATPVYEAKPARLSEVQFSAVYSEILERGCYSMIDVIMFEDEFSHIVDEAMAEVDGKAKKTTSGIVEVEKDTMVKVVLSSPNIEIDDPVSELRWYGKHQRFSFDVYVPESYSGKQILFNAQVYFNGVLATKLKFFAKCVGEAEPVKVERQDILSAFISYASQDRSTVTMIIQGLKKARPDLQIFFDVESLRAGEAWENQLKSKISDCDILYLCWSRNAKDSKWVEFEWRYALANKGIDCIEPIPLEEPSVCQPPEELGCKHFNDLMLYIRK